MLFFHFCATGSLIWLYQYRTEPHPPFWGTLPPLPLTVFLPLFWEIFRGLAWRTLLGGQKCVCVLPLTAKHHHVILVQIFPHPPTKLFVLQRHSLEHSRDLTEYAENLDTLLQDFGECFAGRMNNQWVYKEPHTDWDFCRTHIYLDHLLIFCLAMSSFSTANCAQNDSQ